MSDEGGLPNVGKKFSSHTGRIMLALVVGLGTGLGAVGFRYLISFIHEVFFTRGGSILTPSMGNYYIVILPVIGGLIVGVITTFMVKEVKGHGIPQVMTAVAVRGGKIRPRVVLAQALASGFCIGSGGSTGREGPIVQIGAGMASTIGQFINANTRKMRALVACGAAGGIAATFNAPMGGVLFSLEVILGEFTGSHLMMIILSSVTASVIARAFLGSAPAFMVPSYSLNDPMELVFYIILGVLSAVFAIIYIRVLYKSEDIFAKIKWVPEYIKPAIGGLFVGIIGLKYPQIFGVGYGAVELAITGKIALATTAALVLMKLIATSFTLGSGGSGGVFAPSLYMGAMLGATFGYILNFMFPAIVVNPAAYALVGMGGVFAGCARAPMTAMIMLFELSDNYGIILPLMVTCILSTVIATSLHKESIYTFKLVRRGLDYESVRRPDVLKNVLVRDVMTKTPEIIRGDFTVQDAKEIISGSPHHGFPVLYNDNLYSIITDQQLDDAIKQGYKNKKLIDIVKNNLITIEPDDPLSAATKKLDENNIGRMPVVHPNDNKKLVGWISRTDIIHAYCMGVMRENDEGNEIEEQECVCNYKVKRLKKKSTK
ncbi:MAG: chloride channel protein [Clostridiales bacterium]|nr:chloride channel protein [Clostridiales bacterium]MCF8021246.1 chloride channel protein [Clostridiales bacterium]